MKQFYFGLIFIACTSIKEAYSSGNILSSFSSYFHNLSYEKKQSIVSEALQELQIVFPQGLDVEQIPIDSNLETCQAALKRSVFQNHEWYTLAMGQFTQLKFYNLFINEKVSAEIESALLAAQQSSINNSCPTINQNEITIQGVLYTSEQISSILEESKILKTENVQLRNSIAKLQNDLQQSIRNIEELKLEAQAAIQESKRMKVDLVAMSQKLKLVRAKEENLKKALYYAQRGIFSKVKSALTKPLRNSKIKKILGSEKYKEYQKNKQHEHKQVKQLGKQVKSEVSKRKKERRKKIIDRKNTPLGLIPAESNIIGQREASRSIEPSQSVHSSNMITDSSRIFESSMSPSM
ncbi:hypothetical protein cand_022540 [Cryptosporidium andersoni]|uniref:Uncharacterized protein n=1 Tax=Cryptosporidium andersoni TaxID=117008 RepID=A0A1J4MS66_9CRYT|nr:hypothetical protein cand_022540 [Cryptosporidium andersoni]